MLVSMKEVADRAGVPLKTAVRALSGKTLGLRRDAKERAGRVLKAAKELGFQPSELAKALRSGRTKTLGIVIGGISNPYFGCFAETAFDEARRAGFKMLMEMTRLDAEDARDAMRSLLRHRVDGVLYAQALLDKPDELHRSLMAGAFPVVATLPNSYGYPAFVSDYAPGLDGALAHLRSLGHRRVFLSLSVGVRLRDKAILDAYLDACSRHGVESEFIARRGSDVSELLKRRPEALLIDGALSANAFMKGLDGAARRNFRKPSVVGFYNEWTWWQRPSGLAGAVILPSDSIVRGAVKALAAWAGGSIPSGETSFPTDFISAEDFASFKTKSLDSEALFES